MTFMDDFIIWVGLFLTVVVALAFIFLVVPAIHSENTDRFYTYKTVCSSRGYYAADSRMGDKYRCIEFVGDQRVEHWVGGE